MTSATRATNFGTWIPAIVIALMLFPGLAAAQRGEEGGITIVKNAIPFGDPQDFSFSGDLGDFDLDDDSDGTLPNLTTFTPAPGTYVVTEAPVEGWLLTDLFCNDGDSTVDLGTATATIVYDGVENVTCTFENTQLGKIIIDKVTFPIGDPTGFDFTIAGGGGGPQGVAGSPDFTLADQDPPYMAFLLPGVYSVFETVPMDWELLNGPGICDSEEFADDITVSAGSTTTCVFENRTTVESNLDFIKLFDPDTIGPGSVSTLRFTITNPDGIPAGLLTFSDDLPAGMTIAGFANPTSTCGGIVDAPAGGSTIGFSFGSVAGFGSCEVSVDVTTGTVGLSTNTSKELTSTDGIAVGDGFVLATANLTVDTTLPGFSKSFAPSTVALGGRSTLTFTVDNTANGSDVENLDFTDNLPTGMVIADPANAGTDCESPSPLLVTTLIAAPGTSTIILDADGTSVGNNEVLMAGGTCTVTVDVVATGAGLLGNASDDLLADFVPAGRANATLEVTTDPIHLTKDFTDDPVPPGSSVTLEFTVSNFDRTDSATAVAFSDDLTTLVPALAGLTVDSLLSNDCGGMVSGVGGTTIGLSGGTVAAESFCTLRVSLSVPAAATPGTYTNTTEAVTADVGGTMVSGNMAADDLFVSPVPLLTKEFLDATTMAPDPVVNPGNDVIIRFTVTNTSATSGATDVTFIDELTDGSGGFPPDTTSGFLPFPVTVVLPTTPCGGGSSIALISIAGAGDRQGLSLTGGSLAAAGLTDDSCTFDVTLTIPASLAPGIYLNTTEEPSATVDGATRTGQPASDTLEVIAAPQLTKAFIDDPVAPGDTVTLQFILSYPPDQTAGATAIGFTDDLAAVLPGMSDLMATGLPLMQACDPDGPGGVPGTGTLSGGMGTLTFAGGSLDPGESCSFNVTLSVPADAPPGSYTNTTSMVSATVSGLAATSQEAEDELDINGLAFSKEFIPDTAIAGETVNLKFTIQNIHPTADATLTLFTDNLAAVLPGTPDLTTSLPPTVDTCNGTPSVIIPTSISYGGGSVMQGQTCTVEFDVVVPGGAADGTHVNTSSALFSSLGAIDPAVDQLTINSTLIELTKEFTDDPVAPGDPVTLEFTLTNLDAGQAASDIDFTDDLGAALTTLTASLTFDSVLLNDCGATVTGTGTDVVTVDDAALAAGGSCTIRLSLSVPGDAAANIYTNTTSDVTGMIGGFAVTGDAASDELTVLNLLTFSKSFDGPTVAGGTAVLTFTITNPGPVSAINLAFFDDLNAVIPGLVATGLPTGDVCGSGSQIAGTSFLTLTGGQVAANGGMCTFDVDVAVPPAATAGTFPSTTSILTENGLQVADPAAADLTVEPAPTFAKSFDPDSINLAEVSTLTFTIDNTASTLAAGSLDFTDNLPAGLEVASPPNAGTTCTGGTLTAAAGSSVISYSGGTVAAGASCTVTVDVTGTATGELVNTSGDLTSSSGNSGPATDTLTVAALSFSKLFAPATIGPGSTTLLQFDIANPSAALAESVAFTDVLPAGVVIATPSNALTDCVDGVLSAPDGFTTISLAGARLGMGASCTVVVNVTAAAAGSYDNLSGELTSTVGSGGTAAAALTVDAGLPGFSKSFAPGQIPPGGTSVLTFTIGTPPGEDDGGGPVPASVAWDSLQFNDVLPAGLVVATPSNATTDCDAIAAPILTAGPGTNSISLFNGSTYVGCTVKVDVTAASAGLYLNVSGELTSGAGGVSSGFATAELDAFEGFLIKSFTDDPAIPGANVTLEFKINNPSRDFAATDIEFSDDLDVAMTGLLATGLPIAACGGTLGTSDGGMTIDFTGGSLPAEGSCTFSVTLQLPSVTTGTFTNTTSSITATIDGATEVGDPARDDLKVVAAPSLTKEFLDATTLAPDPVVGAGDDVVMRFAVTNTSTVSGATGIAFLDELTTFLPFPVTVSGPTPDPPCGGGSSFDLVSCGTDCQALELTGGSLAASGVCSFDVTLTLPTGLATNTYVNTTGEITATVDAEVVAGFPASDSFDLVAAPRLTKEFTDDPVQPGGTVTLEFTLEHDALAPGDAVDVEFTDDLAAVVADLAATGLPLADLCGTGNGTLVGTAGDTLLTFSGATLTPGQICTFSVTLSVPATAESGAHTNTTSNVVATVLGVETTENPAEDDLMIGGLILTKEFTDDPVIAGGTVTLEFVITNQSPDPVTDIFFEDPLDPDVLLGLAVSGPLPTDPCGAGSLLETFAGGFPAVTHGLRLSGGSLGPAGPSEGDGACSFSVTLAVPAATASGAYTNRTRDFEATVDSSTVSFPDATDDLVVANELLLLTKEFTDDPVVPGGTVTLEFGIGTLGGFDAASDLEFTDDLNAALPGLLATGLPQSVCGGTVSTPDGGMTIEFSGGTFTGGDCGFSVILDVPAAVPFGTTITNTTSEITGTIETTPVTGEPASDDLMVDLFTFTKSFAGPAMPGQTVVLTFSIENLSTTDSVADLSFVDDLGALVPAVPGLVASGFPANPCGLGSSISGSPVLAFTGGNLLPGGSCTFDVDVQVPPGAAGGSFLNTTSDLEIGGLPVASPATALLQIDAPPTFAKVFVPETIGEGFDTTLTFTIDNTPNGIDAAGLAFVDVLPFDLLVAAVPAVTGDCGGTVTAVPFDTTIELSGGSVDAGEACTISVQVFAPSFRVAVNTSGDLTSSSGNSGPAVNTLTVLECLALNGSNLVLGSDVVLVPKFYEVCNTIEIQQHYLVLGPGGELTLRAGVAVILFNGVEFGDGSTVTIEIDPSLIP